MRLAHHRDGEIRELAAAAWKDSGVYLKVVGNYLDLGFHYSADGHTWRTLVEGIDGSVLSPANIGGFNYTGVNIGLYGSTNGVGTQGSASFEYLEYQPASSDRDDWFARQAQRER